MFKKSILLLGTFFVLSNSFAMGPFLSIEELKLQFVKLRPTLDMQMQATANVLVSTRLSTELPQPEFRAGLFKFATPDNLNENIVSPTDAIEEMIKLIERRKEREYYMRIQERHEENKLKKELCHEMFIEIVCGNHSIDVDAKIECLEMMNLPIEVKNTLIKLIKGSSVEFLNEDVEDKEILADKQDEYNEITQD